VIRRLGVVLLVVVLLVGVAVGVDLVTRARTESLLGADLRRGGLMDPKVTITGMPFLTQLLGGEFHKVRVSGTSVLVDGLELDHVRATLIGLDAKAPARVATATATAEVTPAALTAALGADMDFSIADGALVATLRSAPLSASVVPHVSGDRVDLEVKDLALSGVAVAPQDLPLGLGDAFEGLSLEVTGLPEGMHLDGLTVGATALDVSLSGTDVALPTAP
jgi:hypothetical protein